MSRFAIPALAAAFLAVPSPALAGPADCNAVAKPPVASGGQVYAEATFTCSWPVTQVSLTLCVDLFWMDNPPAFGPHTCEDVTLYGPTRVFTHGMWACVQGGPLVRTTVSGRTAEGHEASATSIPAPTPVGSCGP